MGKIICYTYLLRRIKELWKPTSPIDIISIENGFYLVKFNSADDYEHALLEGPWVIADHYLTISRWCSEFDPFQATFEKLTVWIRFPCLPIEYYDENFLMRVGAKVGKPIRVDTRTSLVSRGRFARMCVEVDLSKPLLSKFKLQKRIRKIEYEGLHMICFKCGRFGHVADHCPAKTHSSNPDVPVTVTVVNDEGVDARFKDVNPKILEDFGEWMMVRKERKHSGKKDLSDKDGNRFQTLNEVVEEDVMVNEKGSDQVHGATEQHISTAGSKGKGVQVERNYGPKNISATTLKTHSGNRTSPPVPRAQPVSISGKEAIPYASGTTPRSSSVRPAVSRQAAAEKEQVVVRGSRGSDEVHKWVVAQKDGRVGLANLENPAVSVDNHKDPQFPHPSALDNVGIIEHNTMEMDTALLGASTSVNMGTDQAERNGDVEGPVDDPMTLLETRVSGSQADKICRDLGFKHWLRVEAFGFSEGIWVCWNNNGFELEVLNTHPQFINCRIKPTWGSPWIVSFVYGSPNTGLRHLLWEDLRLSCLNMDEEWVVLGDFDAADWLFDTALVDMGYEGVPITWSRSDGRDGIKMARLDRGVCTMAWQWRFAEAMIIHPPKFHSDHCPIILSLGEQPLPNGNFFRCQAAWFAHPDFVDSVRTIWNHSNELWSNIESLQ
uniref:CCHC-type domain-containing protein n=1 Tax=Manihot esculenta TaxID=3983 RepID=A0A2C9W6H0_MANES